MDDATAASYIGTSLNFVFRDIYLEESEIIPTRKIKTEIEKPNLQIETLLEIFQKQNMHEREGTDFVIKQFDGTQKATDWSMKYSYFTYASLPYSNMSMKPNTKNTKSKLMKKGSRI